MTRIQLAIRSPYISLLFTPKWRLHLPSELPQVSYYSIVHPHWNVLSSALSSALLLTPRISYPKECSCNTLDSSNPDFASHVSAASNIGCISVYSQQDPPCT